jgi:hypothetical protein
LGEPISEADGRKNNQEKPVFYLLNTMAKLSIPSGIKFKVEITPLEIIKYVLIWALLLVVTLGFAIFVVHYYVVRFVIGKANLVNSKGEKQGKLKNDLSFTSALGHSVFWFFFSIVTLGIAGFFYPYYFLRLIINNTYIDSDNSKTQRSKKEIAGSG